MNSKNPSARPDRNSLKPVVITGGTSGIGLATAERLLRSGQFRLCIVSRGEDKIAEARSHLANCLPEGASSSKDLLTFYDCDLTDSRALKATVEKIKAVYSNGIYGLVNNAGVYPLAGVDTTTEGVWDQTHALNVKAPFLLIQGLMDNLRKSPWGARIVNVSSTAGILPNSFALAYSVSKAALIQLTRTLAKELGKDRITVNCVAPGIVRSPMHEGYHRTDAELESFYAKRGATFPLGRVGEPADVAAVIDFFLSDAAAWVTGDVLIADGGRLLL